MNQLKEEEEAALLAASQMDSCFRCVYGLTYADDVECVCDDVSDKFIFDAENNWTSDPDERVDTFYEYCAKHCGHYLA